MEGVKKRLWSAWPPSRHRGPERGPVVLHYRRIYILPTRHGAVFAAVLFAMLMGSINYANSLGFILTFLLGGMATVSMLHAYRNLAGLTVQSGQTEAVFAGQWARFTVCLRNPGGQSRYAIAVQRQSDTAALTDLSSGETACLPVTMPAPRRGGLPLGRFAVFTEFPLGLFRAWSWLELDLTCTVYPRPEPESPPAPAGGRSGEEGRPLNTGSEDFEGLRPYHPGDSMRHVAWKALAHTDNLLTKRFSGRAEQSLWLDWDALGGLDTEARLSRLCRWVLDAEAAGLSYGLRLPDKTLQPASGDGHRHRCLEALALFNAPSQASPQ